MRLRTSSNLSQTAHSLACPRQATMRKSFNNCTELEAWVDQADHLLCNRQLRKQYKKKNRKCENVEKPIYQYTP